MRGMLALALLLLGLGQPQVGGPLLIPMDQTQRDHLKAYGVAYWALERGAPVEWLLNYRGGAFLLDEIAGVVGVARLRGVSFQRLTFGEREGVYEEIEGGNMERILLEKAPSVAVYTPPHLLPWDDAVTLALTYAEIPYEKVWDAEALNGELSSFDWLHLHHEDFTGQYNRFFVPFAGELWLQEEVVRNEEVAARLGFSKVWELKHAVAEAIKAYVRQGGFLFAMCSATETLEIALAAGEVDVVPAVIDGDPTHPQAQERLDYGQTLAFKDFQLQMNPALASFSSIDGHQVNTPMREPLGRFRLFQFSAKVDPVSTLLTQNHTQELPGFYGLTSSFRREVLKDGVTVLAEEPGRQWVKYIHGALGDGTFTFFGGHDPEDPQHAIGDPATDLRLHRNSPGYRLILNNVLFPAAKKKELKT